MESTAHINLCTDDEQRTQSAEKCAIANSSSSSVPIAARPCNQTPAVDTIASQIRIAPSSIAPVRQDTSPAPTPTNTPRSPLAPIAQLAAAMDSNQYASILAQIPGLLSALQVQLKLIN